MDYPAHAPGEGLLGNAEGVSKRIRPLLRDLIGDIIIAIGFLLAVLRRTRFVFGCRGRSFMPRSEIRNGAPHGEFFLGCGYCRRVTERDESPGCMHPFESMRSEEHRLNSSH